MHKGLKSILLCMTVSLSLAACVDQNDSDDPYRTQEGATENRYQTMNTQNGRMQNRQNGNMFNQNNAGMHTNTRMEQSEELAEQITNIDHVERAMVFLTDRNAYVGVVLEEGTDWSTSDDTQFQGNNDGSDMDAGKPETADQLPRDIKREISQQVKTMKPEITNVFVSANPDFINRLDDYVTALDEGRPVSGMIDEFNEMVERIFPTRSGDGFDNGSESPNAMGNVQGRSSGSNAPFTTRAR